MTAVKPSSPPLTRSRGRPRSEVARGAILKAAAELIERGGIGAVTMEAVATRAGVGKPTVYRNWPNADALAMAALMSTTRMPKVVPATARALDDLRLQLRRVARTFSAPSGRNAALMIASADGDSELAKAFRNQVMRASREEGRHLVQRAVADGEVRPDIRIEVVLDVLYGPIFFRLLMGHARIGEGFTDDLLDEAVAGLRA